MRPASPAVPAVDLCRKWVKSLALAWTLVLALAPGAHALKFSNQFVEFELPHNWKCGLEGTEWVCQSLDDAKKRDAIIVLAAKLKGDQDTLQNYQSYLDKPKSVTAAGGKALTSQVRYSKMNKILEHLWVDALHMESELPNFYTRYLATIFQDIAVLVTYSVNKTKIGDYQNQFDDMIRSLRVFRKKGGLLAQNASIFAQNSGAISGAGIFDQKAAQPVAKKPKPADDGGGAAGGLLLLLAAGGAGFFIWKKKRQNA